MKWLRFILSHSIFVSFCAVALAYQTGLLLHLQVSPFIYGFIFFATLCSYNFYWIISKVSFTNKMDVTGLVKNEITGIVLFFVAAAGALVCFVGSTLPPGYVITAILLTVVYALPILPFRFLQFTRRAGVLKTFLLAFTWAFVTVILPLQKPLWLLTDAHLFIFSRRFLFMLMLCIIFDNRDKHVDKIRGLRSLATELKPVALKAFIYIIFITLFISNFLYKDFGLTFLQSIALQVSTVALLLVYFYAAKKRSYFFYYFIVDGMMLFSALATYIAGI